MSLHAETDVNADFAALDEVMASDSTPLSDALPKVLEAFDAIRARGDGSERSFLERLAAMTCSREDVAAEIGLALRGGFAPAAVGYLRQVISRRGGPEPRLLDALIDSLRHAGQPAEALETARQLRRMQPDSAVVRVIEAEATRHVGDHEEAERLLRDALPLVRDNPWVPFWLAEYAARREDWDEVWALLQPVMPIFSHRPAAELFCRAGLFAALLRDDAGSSEDAGALIGRAAEKLEVLARAYPDLLGEAAAGRGGELARLLGLARRHGSAAAQDGVRAALYASATGDAGEAMDVAGWLDRAGCQADAREYLLRAWPRAGLGGHLVGWRCAELSRRDGFPAEADRIVGELLCSHRGDYAALTELAEHAQAVERFVDEDLFRAAALAARPDCPGTRLRLAELATAAGDDGRVAGLLRGFAPLADHPRALLLLARASFATGRYDEAAGLAGRVLDIWPGDDETRGFLSRLSALITARNVLLDEGAAALLDSETLLGHGRVLLNHGIRAPVVSALAPRMEEATPPVLAMLAEAAFDADEGALARRALNRLLATTEPAGLAAFARALEQAGDFAVRGGACFEAADWYRRAIALAPSAHLEFKLADLERRRDEARPNAIADRIAPLSIATGDIISGRMIGLAEAARDHADAHFTIPFERVPLDFERERFERFDQHHAEPLALHLGVFQNVLCGEIYAPLLPEHRRLIFNATYSNFASSGTPVRVFGRAFEYTVERPVEVIDDPVVIIGGSVEYNYYHWLLNWMPRIMIAEAVEAIWPELGRFKYLVHPNVLSVPQFRESIERLGIPRERLLAADPSNKVLLLRRCAIPSFMVQRFYHSQVLDFVRRRVGGVAEARPVAPTTGRRVFISRQGVRGPKRRIHNYDAIFPVLNKHGFEIVEMEAMSLGEQIELARDASFICAMSGAALANLVFASPGGKLLLLSPDYLHEAATYRYWSGLARLLDFGMEFFLIDHFFDGEREWRSGERAFHPIGDMNLDAVIDPQALDVWLARQTASTD